MNEFETDQMEMPLECQANEETLECEKEEVNEELEKTNEDAENIKHLHNMLMLSSEIVQTINDMKYQYERFKKLVYKHGGFHHSHSLIKTYSRYLSLQKIIKQYVNVLEISLMSIQDYYCNPEVPSSVVAFHDEVKIKHQYIKNLEKELSSFKFEKMGEKLAIYQLSYFLEELSKYFPVDGDTDSEAFIKIDNFLNKEF